MHMAHKGTWRNPIRELILIWPNADFMLKLSTSIFVMLVLVVPNPGFADPAVDGLDSKVTGIGPLDAETQRYQAELSQLGLDQNEIMSMVYGFKIAEVNLRADIWDQLEQQKIQHAETNLPQIIADIEAENAQRSSDHDGETLRYKSALQQAGYSQAEVDGLTEIFAPAPQVVRQVYWKEVKNSANN